MGGENSVEVGEKAVTSFSYIYAYKAWCLQFEKTKNFSLAIFQVSCEGIVKCPLSSDQWST